MKSKHGKFNRFCSCQWWRAGGKPKPINLEDGALAVQEVNGGADALVKLENGEWQLLLLDRRLPDLDVEELTGIVKVRHPGIQIILLDSTNDSAAEWRTVRARFDSWLRPSPPNRLASAPIAASMAGEPLPGMIGMSESMRRLYRLTRLVAPRNTTVLVQGATGTGKELVARAVHQLSPRRAGPWAVVNCAAIPESLLEAELFGYARGAFTGAAQTYVGRICAAQGGTLFLDEVGELPLNLQAKLLRFLEQKEVQRLGTSEVLRVDVRVIAATNAELEVRAQRGQFRSDLYYRLAAFPLELPSLADRREDIVPLAEHFLRQLADAAGKTTPELSSECAQQLEAHGWNGNVRELQQVMERAAILAGDASEILPEHLNLPAPLRTCPGVEAPGPRRPIH